MSKRTDKQAKKLAKQKQPPQKQAKKQQKTRPPKDASFLLAEFPEELRPRVAAFFDALSSRMLLPKKQRQAMLGDFAAALGHYSRTGLPLSEALLRLDPQKLGGFYARPPVLWFPLDSAAKIYPLSMKRHTMSVFRLSVYLKEPVVPELLQIALTFVIKRFPCFATTVKNGFFWHYLDASKRRYDVLPETERPCAPIPVWASGSQTFRVLYFQNRVSVEFFHVLTDGSGGMHFLSTLVAEYLRLLGHSVPNGGNVLDIAESPPVREAENGFELAEPTQKSKGFRDSAAVQMSGAISFVRPCQILHFELSSTALLAAARARGVSITAYLLAILFIATRSATDEQAGNIQIQVPVNMRKYFDSPTVRNFSMYCSIRLPVGRVTEIGALLPAITEQLAQKTARQPMNDMMNAALQMARSLRFVPLFIKRPVARLAYGFVGDMVFSNTLSNLGVVRFPEEMAQHVDKLDFVLGTGVTNRAACSLITFEDKTVLTVSKLTLDPSFEEKLYELLCAEGLNPDVSGSERYED